MQFRAPTFSFLHRIRKENNFRGQWILFKKETLWTLQIIPRGFYKDLLLLRGEGIIGFRVYSPFLNILQNEIYFSD